MIELFCSSETFRDSYPKYLPIRKWIEATLGEQLRYVNTRGRPVLISLIPSIMPPSTAVEYYEIMRYQSEGNEIEFRPAFDYTEFMDLPETDQKKLIVRSLSKIVPMIDKLDLEPEAKVELRETIQAFITDNSRD